MKTQNKMLEVVKGYRGAQRVALLRFETGMVTGVVHAACVRRHTPEAGVPDDMQAYPVACLATEALRKHPAKEPCALCGCVKLDDYEELKQVERERAEMEGA